MFTQDPFPFFDMMRIFLDDVKVCFIFVCFEQPTSAGAPGKDQRSDTWMYRSWRSNPNTLTAKRR